MPRRVTDHIPLTEAAELVAAGVAIRALAAHYAVSYSSMRTCLIRHRVVTPRAQRLLDTRPRVAQAASVEARCPEHGLTLFVRRGRGFRCARCRIEAVDRRRRSVKEVLVTEAGGGCQLCGYDRSLAALHFHHVDRGRKRFALSERGVTRGVAGGTGGGRAVRPALRQLPRGGRSGSRSATLHGRGHREVACRGPG